MAFLVCALIYTYTNRLFHTKKGEIKAKRVKASNKMLL